MKYFCSILAIFCACSTTNKIEPNEPPSKGLEASPALRFAFSPKLPFSYDLTATTTTNTQVFETPIKQRNEDSGTISLIGRDEETAWVAFHDVKEKMIVDDEAEKAFEQTLPTFLLEGLQEDGSLETKPMLGTSMFLKLLFLLPTKKLAVGESEKIPVKFPVEIAGQVAMSSGSVTLTLSRYVKVDGRECALLEINADLPSIAIPEELPFDGTFSLTGKLVSYFDLEAKTFASVDGSFLLHTELKEKQGTKVAPTTIEQTITLKRNPAKEKLLQSKATPPKAATLAPSVYLSELDPNNYPEIKDLQPPSTFAFGFSPGRKLGYQMTQKSMHENESIGFEGILQIEAKDTESASLLFEILSAKRMVGGEEKKIKVPPAIRVEGLQKNGELLLDAPNSLSVILPFLFPLPKKAISLGESFQVPATFPVNYNGSSLLCTGTTTTTLLRYVNIKGHTAAQLGFEISISKLDIPDGFDMGGRATLKGRGVAYFDLQDKTFSYIALALVIKNEFRFPTPGVDTPGEYQEVLIDQLITLRRDPALESK